MAQSPAQHPAGANPASRASVALLDRWIDFWAGVFELCGALYYLASDTIGWAWRGFVTRSVRMGMSAITSQIVRVELPA